MTARDGWRSPDVLANGILPIESLRNASISSWDERQKALMGMVLDFFRPMLVVIA
ncbi:MAG: hypothetical protein KME17_03560 [Cyanosarcina radialis HA8281-LM2]|jgi:hypothetical protein|nr:hypothetical protein [Cyanosarcina radialis HA8281-LM2]